MLCYNIHNLYYYFKQHRSYSKWVQKFSKLNTDNERVAFVWGFVLQYDLASSCKHKFNKRNDKYSELSLQKIKKIVQKNELSEAVMLYSKAILEIEPNSPLLPLAYFYRSNILYRLKKFEECIDDTKRALASPLLPQKDHYIVLTRQGESFKQLQYYVAAKDSFCTALQSLEKAEFASTSVKVAWESKLKRDVDKCSQLAAEHKNNRKYLPLKPFEASLPFLKYGARDDMPAVSNGVELRYNEEMGRYLVATKEFLPGDVVLVEHPYAVVTENITFSRTRRCSHCFVACTAVVPCDICSWVSFCSEDCRKMAYRYHKIECSMIMTTLDFFCANEKLDVKLVIRILVSTDPEILDYYALNPPPPPKDPMTAGFTNGKYFSDDFEALYHLVRHSEKRSTSDLIRLSLMAVCIIELLTPFLKNAERYAGLTLRLLQIVNLNNASVRELTLSFTEQLGPNFLGKSIPLTLSLLNHSCDSNLGLVSYGSIQVLRSIQTINPGAILTLPYCSRFFFEEQEVRQKFLLENYLFQCKCVACVENWPTSCHWPATPEKYLSKDVNKVWESRRQISEFHLQEIVKGNFTEEMSREFSRHLVFLDFYKARLCTAYSVCQRCVLFFFSIQGNLAQIDS